jgi:hypothetical protein
LKARRNGSRLRFPSGVLAGRLDWFARGALFELVLDEVPIAGSTEALVEALGLPADLCSFPPDPEAKDYPGFVEILQGALALDQLGKEARLASRVELDWACAAVGTFVSFVVGLARYVDLTSSPLPIISHPDPAVVASGQHVGRTLIVCGRALDRCCTWKGPGSAEWLATFAGPMLLRMLSALPRRARYDVQSWTEALAAQLPLIEAMISLVKAVTPEHRHLLSFNWAERIGTASEAEREALRAQALAWAETHRAGVACLAGYGLASPG